MTLNLMNIKLRISSHVTFFTVNEKSWQFDLVDLIENQSAGIVLHARPALTIVSGVVTSFGFFFPSPEYRQVRREERQRATSR